MEVGVGTGRFAEPLGIDTGVEPSKHMREMAQKRGIRVLDGVAEALPFGDCRFDFLLMVTTICFLDDIKAALKEAYRVLCDKGLLIIGFIDRNSAVGQRYLDRRGESVFYKEAVFFSVEELVERMVQAGFIDFIFSQTIFNRPTGIKSEEPVKPGHGEGSFVVVRGRKELAGVAGE